MIMGFCIFLINKKATSYLSMSLVYLQQQFVTAFYDKDFKIDSVFEHVYQTINEAAIYKYQ